jgi:hypothetical protein
VAASMQIQEIVLSTAKIDLERWEDIARGCTERGIDCRKLRIGFE